MAVADDERLVRGRAVDAESVVGAGRVGVADRDGARENGAAADAHVERPETRIEPHVVGDGDPAVARNVADAGPLDGGRVLGVMPGRGRLGEDR